MRRFLVAVLLAAAGVALGLFIPREIPEGARLSVRWQYRIVPTAISPVDASTAGVVSEVPTVLAITDSFYLRFTASEGQLVGGGPRTSGFTSSNEWFINQRSQTPRWAVQSWSGGIPRFIDATGVPRLTESLLYQIDDDGAFAITDLSTIEGPPIRIPGIDALSAYHLCRRCDPPILVRGTWLGTVRLDALSGDEYGSYRIEVDPFAAQSPTIYGVEAIDSEGIVVVAGTDPQFVSVLGLDEDGALRESDRYSVDDTIRVRSPIDLVRIDDTTVGVPLRSTVLLITNRGETAQWVSVPGLTAVNGGERTAGTTVFLGTTTSGANLFITGRTDVVEWSWNDAAVAGYLLEETERVALIYRDDLVIAVEVKS